jgi:hypothetical protein
VKSSFLWEGTRYHLHPEAVTTVESAGVRSTLWLYSSCSTSLVKKKKVPPLSIAGGMDYGVLERLHGTEWALPPQWSLVEEAVLQLFRVYGTTVKLAAGKTVLSGHVVTVPQNGPVVAHKTLAAAVDGVHASVSFTFLGLLRPEYSEFEGLFFADLAAATARLEAIGDDIIANALTEEDEAEAAKLQDMDKAAQDDVAQVRGDGDGDAPAGSAVTIGDIGNVLLAPREGVNMPAAVDYSAVAAELTGGEAAAIDELDGGNLGIEFTGN